MKYNIHLVLQRTHVWADDDSSSWLSVICFACFAGNAFVLLCRSLVLQYSGTIGISTASSLIVCTKSFLARQDSTSLIIISEAGHMGACEVVNAVLELLSSDV